MREESESIHNQQCIGQLNYSSSDVSFKPDIYRIDQNSKESLPHIVKPRTSRTVYIQGTDERRIFYS